MHDIIIWMCMLPIPMAFSSEYLHSTHVLALNKLLKSSSCSSLRFLWLVWKYGHVVTDSSINI